MPKAKAMKRRGASGRGVVVGMAEPKKHVSQRNAPSQRFATVGYEFACRNRV